MIEQELIERLNADTKEERLNALKELRRMADAGLIPEPQRLSDTNNHVHTTYSFSPYSPTAAVYKAYKTGLVTVGIIDHDSIAGAREFIEAGEIMGITTTVGCEVRVSFADTPLNGRVLNNPDEDTVAYIALHGVPHNNIEKLDAFLSEIREARNRRNAKQVDNLNKITAPYGIKLSFENDVLPISMSAQGGSVTERHILYALSLKLIEKYGRGEALIRFLENDMGFDLSPKAKQKLSDTDDEYYAYSVLNVLKSDLNPRMFIKGGADSLPVKEVVAFAREIGAIPTYCYLGDVEESVTGDKKAQKFEDDCLDEIFEQAKELGFEAIAYMPSRNTEAQLDRVMQKCAEYGFMEISGEDINQPSQSFICLKMRDPKYSHLADSAWALVGHERAAGQNPENSIYSDATKQKHPDMGARIKAYKELGMRNQK